VQNRIHAFKSRLSHWLQAVDDHSIHAPFAYRFYQEVVKDKIVPELYPLEQEIHTQRHNHQLITLNDFGAGAQRAHKRKLSHIARTSHNRKVGRLLFRLVRHIQPKNIMELGTNLGFSSAAMALAAPQTQIVTLEGSSQLVAKAKELMHNLGLARVKVVNCNIDDCLTKELGKSSTWDLIFVDANHRYHPTLNYFDASIKEINENSVMVLDDIHWSSEMSRAWDLLRKHPRVILSMDLYQLGILFFNEKLTKKHYILA